MALTGHTLAHYTRFRNGKHSSSVAQTGINQQKNCNSLHCIGKVGTKLTHTGKRSLTLILWRLHFVNIFTNIILSKILLTLMVFQETLFPIPCIFLHMQSSLSGGAHVKCNLEILSQFFLAQVLLKFSWSVGCRADYLALRVQKHQ